MKIQVCNTLSILREIEHLDVTSKNAIWQEHVISTFKPMTDVTGMDFSAMGICDISTSFNEYESALNIFLKENIIERIQAAVKNAFLAFQKNGSYRFPPTLTVGVFISNRKNPIHEDLNHGFTGFGGIPGFIILILSPTDYVLKSLEALAAHEFHHNIRFLIEPWPQDRNISVGKYLLDEGLAEAFAAELYGEASIGPETIGLSEEELSKAAEIILPNVAVKGFQAASSYLFGDVMADRFGYPKTGLPHGAGYALGYRLVQNYCATTQTNIFAATLESSEEIMSKLNILND